MAEQPHGNALTPEEQDEIFVKLQPYLQRGHKLWRCIVFAGLTSRKDAIYKYYNERVVVPPYTLSGVIRLKFVCQVVLSRFL
jgi:hypothetical protein